MNKRMVLLCLAGVAFGIGSAAADPVKKEQLVGTWNYVLATNTNADGSKFYPNGQNGAGLLMFDNAGNFSWHIIKPDIPKYASNNRLQGTPEENKATVQGVLSYFGTYTVDPDGNGMTMNIKASSFPNFTGQSQKRKVSLSGDELTIVNAAGASGGTAEVKWQRGK